MKFNDPKKLLAAQQKRHAEKLKEFKADHEKHLAHIDACVKKFVCPGCGKKSNTLIEGVAEGRVISVHWCCPVGQVQGTKFIEETSFEDSASWTSDDS